jgi:hypothetical protein
MLADSNHLEKMHLFMPTVLPIKHSTHKVLLLERIPVPKIIPNQYQVSKHAYSIMKSAGGAFCVSATKVPTGHNSHRTKANVWFILSRMLTLHYNLHLAA